mgnify:CR=1 FL=1|jgi:hypothetical protein
MSDDNIISQLVTSVIQHETSDEAIRLMNLLRYEAMRLDRHLADPRHQWNSIGNR